MKYKVLFMSLWLLRAGRCDEAAMVEAFLKMDDKPTVLLMPHICWNDYKLVKLSKSLCDAGVPLGYSFQPNSTEYFLHHLVVLADLDCPGTEQFLMQANEKEYFKSPYRWLLITSDDDQWTVLEDLNILIDSDVILAKKINEQHFLFIEVYKILETTELIFYTRASWKGIERPNIFNSSYTEITASNSLGLYDASRENNIETKNNGLLEDYRRSKVLSSRRNNVRRYPLTMVNVITDSNETRKHMSDRLLVDIVTRVSIISLLSVRTRDRRLSQRSVHCGPQLITISTNLTNLHQDSIAKMSYAIVSICFEMMNASERLIFTHTWGYKDKNGNWQGVVDYLMKKEGDLGTLTIFTQERMQVVDYIAMVGSTAVRFVFREPPLAYLANIFALPFTGMVWLAIFICVLGCALFLYITSKWEASMSMHSLQLDGSWADVLILIIGAVLQQGCTLEPRYAAGRVVMLILFIAMTILYAAYSANIVVLLRAPSSSVRSLPDLLNSPLKLGASDFEYNRYFFKKLNEPVRKAIYDKKIAPKGKKPNFYNMEEGVEKIRQGLFAFHMELNPGYRLIQETYQEHEKCDLVEIDYINEINPWVPGQKRAANKELYKINFMKIRETGIQSCMHHRLHVPKPKCSGTVSTFSSVGITDMYPAMLATLYGFLLAPAMLILEIFYHRLMEIRSRRAKSTAHEDSPLRFYYD